MRLLATSREPLRIDGEYVYRLPSLAFPPQSDTLAVADALGYGAIALFVQRAAASDAKFGLTDESAPIVAEICRRLDGIALAIELAAARVKVLTPRHLAQKLDERFRVLTGGSRTALPRQQTMRALIDWSYDLLSPKEQTLFRRLAIFVGGWTLEIAAAVCADGEASEDAIESVGDSRPALIACRQVVSAGRDNGQAECAIGSWNQRDSMRANALPRPKRTPPLRERTRLHILALGEELYGIFETTRERAWLARAEPELENFRAALRWAFGAQGDVLLGQRLAAALRPAWTRFAAAEGQRRIRAARDLSVSADARARWRPHSTLPKRRSRQRLLNGRRRASGQNARWRSIAELDDALARCAGATSTRPCARRSRDDRRRRNDADPGVKEARALGVPSVIGDVLQSLAIARSHAGDVAGARPLFAEALAMFRSIGAERVCSHIAGNLAEAEFHEGNAVEALRLENEALATYRTFNHKLGAAISLCNIAAYLICAGTLRRCLRFSPRWASQPHATRNGRLASHGVCSISRRSLRYGRPTMRSICAAIGSALRGF